MSPEEITSIVALYEDYKNPQTKEKPFVVVGPEGANKDFLRIYAYGGKVGYISTEKKDSKLCSADYTDFLKEKHINLKKQEFNAPQWVLDKYEKHISKSIIEGGLKASFESLINHSNNDETSDKHEGDTNDAVLKSIQYIDYVMAAAQNRWKKKNSDINESERRIQTNLVKSFRKSNYIKGAIIVTDMEFNIAMPETEVVRKEDKDKKKRIYKKPDLIVFDGTSFGLVELKYNGESLDNLGTHYLDFCNWLAEANDPIRENDEYWYRKAEKSKEEVKEAINKTRWNILNECLFRAKSLCNQGLIRKEWKKCFDSISDKYKIQLDSKKGEFPKQLLWCGFYFVGGDKDKIEEEIIKQLSNKIHVSNIKPRFEYCDKTDKIEVIKLNYTVDDFLNVLKLKYTPNQKRD